MADSDNGTGPKRRRRRRPSKRAVRVAGDIAEVARAPRPRATIAKHIREKGVRPAGKPSILTEPVRIATILEALRNGAPLSLAADLAGVATATVEEWMRRAMGTDDRPPRPEHIAFARAVTTAKAEAHMYALSQVRNQMPRDFQASKFWLTSQYPDVWGTGLPTPAPSAPTAIAAQQNNIVVIAPDQLEALGLAALAAQFTSEAPDGAGSRALDDLIVDGDDADLSTA